MESNSDPFNTNAWMHQYAALQEQQQRARQQSDNMPAGQASFERQLSDLQLSSSDERSGDAASPNTPPAEAHGSIQRTDVGGSMRMPPQSNLRDNRFSSTRYSVDFPRPHLGSAEKAVQSDLRDRLFSSTRYTAQSESGPVARTRDKKSGGLWSRVKSGLGNEGRPGLRWEESTSRSGGEHSRGDRAAGGKQAGGRQRAGASDVQTLPPSLRSSRKGIMSRLGSGVGKMFGLSRSSKESSSQAVVSTDFHIDYAKRGREVIEASLDPQERELHPAHRRSAAEWEAATPEPVHHGSTDYPMSPVTQDSGADAAPTTEQLTKCERGLRRDEIEQLRQLRQYQRQQLRLAAQPDLPQEHHVRHPQACIDMARDNLLADRNEYGWALPFLDGGATPEKNAGWLDKYLQMLRRSATSPQSNQYRPDLERCTDLAAHYLVKTDWFVDAPLQQLVRLGSNLSKHPRRATCMQAVAWIAGEVLEHDGLPELSAKNLALLANALSKNTRSDRCEQAVARLGRVLLRERLDRDLTAQGASLVLNAMSKWSGNPDCHSAGERLAGRIAHDAALIWEMGAQAVANSLNALSKWPDSSASQSASERLAERISNDVDLVRDMDAQNVANSLNALSKWPGSPACRSAGESLGERVASDDTLLQEMNAEAVASTFNALSKWLDSPVFQMTGRLMAERIANDAPLVENMDERHLAELLNALSKWPENRSCRKAGRRLAERITGDDALLQQMNARDVAHSLNALSKWPNSSACQSASERLAERISNDVGLLRDMDAQNVANSLNALSKWPGNEVCLATTERLAEWVASEDTLLQEMNAQEVAMSLNALCGSPHAPDWRWTSIRLADRTGGADLPWRDFDMGTLAQVGNALTHLSHSAVDAEDEAEVQALARAKLQGLAAHLDLHRDRFETAQAQDIAMIFKALAHEQLQREMRPLAGPALNRVANLCRETHLRETDLESVGNLCLGLLPLARSQELSRHHRQALSVFDEMQPIVARKIDRFLQGQQADDAPTVASAAPADELHATRCPALTSYQVLKTYAVVSRQWKPRNVEGQRSAVRARREQLATWVTETLGRTRETIESDLGQMSWNLIAQIEAGDEVLNALDLHMLAHFEQVTQIHAPSDFSVQDVHQSMRTRPGRPQPLSPGAGDTRRVVVDMQGQMLKSNMDDESKPYSLFARLTGLPLVEVQLPGSLSAFMLARTFNFLGEPWRFDLFGGSRLSRGGQQRASDILSGGAKAPSMLPAVRYADTAPGSALMQLAAKLAPQREDWSRMQRALLEMVPHDHVVEGTLRIGFIDDVPGPQHPFKLAGPGGQHIALCPNDGCGFLKFEVAMRIPAVRKHYDAWAAMRTGHASEEQRKLVAEESELKRLAPQALQHFPYDVEAIEEAHQAMQRRLRNLARQQGDSSVGRPGLGIDSTTLYDLTVSGGYAGQKIRAVPSADDKVHLPHQRSAAFDRAGGALLLGKPPYDKENLLPVPEERVATVAQGDPTAQFLSRCFAIQYSYAGFNDDSGEDAEMLHSKGMLIIPPKGCWSPAHEDMDLVCSKEDLKTLSRWTDGRDRAAAPSDMLSTGSLRVKEIVQPGRLGALPINELRKRNMDCDGDDAFVYAGYPKLAALIERVMDGRAARRSQPRSFKPPKTATPAFDDSGHYQPGRASEILAEQRGRKLMGSASTLATRFLSQPDDLREAMAHSMMFGTYDGVERSLRNGLSAVLESPQPDRQALYPLAIQAHQAIGRAHMHEAREAALLLYGEVFRHYQASGQPMASGPAEVSAALAQRFPDLAQAYVQAVDTPARIHAILDNYPVCRLSHERFPDGQPGLVPGEPELTMRNLFTIAIKVGTDALKSDTGTALFSKVIEACERQEAKFPDRVRNVPHGKETARAMRHNRFDADQVKSVLQRMPTMASGVMHDAVQSLQQAGMLARPPAPSARLGKTPRAEVSRAAGALFDRARQMDREITPMLQQVVSAFGGDLAGLEHRQKSKGSLHKKLDSLMAAKNKNLEEAVADVNDALRYSVVLPPQNFTEGCRRILAMLDQQGHARTKLTNHFTKSEAFSAVSVTLRNPAGAPWETQFHTAETFALKERYHDVYKSAQDMRLKGASAEQLRALTREAWLAFRGIPMPPGCDEIEDWQEHSYAHGAESWNAPSFQASDTRPTGVQDWVGDASTPGYDGHRPALSVPSAAYQAPAQVLGGASLPDLPVGPLTHTLHTFLEQFNAEVGQASGQGLNCLLDTVLQVAHNTKRQDHETPQTGQLRQQVRSLRNSLVQVGAVDPHGEIDLYGAEGVGVLLANNLGVSIQAIEADANGRLTVHPVLGEGRLVHILHTPGHFQPLWPRH
ncbi:type III effector protein [Mesorhizobium sp. YC-39]|uniref:Shikimate kinase n=1 Tax=Mesorhizobium robiniae TaxID=559315 RepID=A0ABV2GZ93_9HYPH|nr:MULTISPECIES: XopAD/skwp family type III secretion system effector [unclassified Mesorhizobium]MCV3211840.1 type III effector protein [Mesorhizobium sp. YC-2]MCV3233564.1 type III effector protein [Mesorhizobium sp. YC-39]MCV3244073.1 type III effector protein [Mesorhizobium sp. ZC-5]